MLRSIYPSIIHLFTLHTSLYIFIDKYNQQLLRTQYGVTFIFEDLSISHLGLTPATIAHHHCHHRPDFGLKRGVSRYDGARPSSLHFKSFWPPATMADKRDQINWNSSAAIWSRVPSAKSAVTRACTTIDKLVERDFVFDTPAACSDARKRLTDAFDFCVELHDRWGDLETEAGTASANEAAEASLKPYEERQDAALTKLNKYISRNSPTQGSARAASAQSTSAADTPKISTCKLLFPSQLTKSNTPGEMRLWLASF